MARKRVSRDEVEAATARYLADGGEITRLAPETGPVLEQYTALRQSGGWTWQVPVVRWDEVTA